MRVIGRRSDEVFLEMIVLIFSIIMFTAISIAEHFSAYLLFVVILIFVLIFDVLPKMSLPKEIVLYDAQTKEITVYRNKNEFQTFGLSEIRNISQDVSRKRGSSTVCIHFHLNDGRDVEAKYLEDTDDIMNLLLQASKED